MNSQNNFENKTQFEDQTQGKETIQSSSGEHSHAHFEHHHHHHRKRSSRLRKQLRQVRRFLKQNLRAVLSVGFVFLALVVLSVISVNEFFKPADGSGEQQSQLAYADGFLQFGVPLYDEEIPLISDAAVKFLNSDISLNAADFLAPYRTDGARLDTGLSVCLDFQIGGLGEGMVVRTIKVEVDENADFSAPRVYELAPEKRSLDIPYLKCATEYHWRITVSLSNGTENSVCGNFKTADTPRILSIEGLVNVRDIGGWSTRTGKKIRQGLLIRGSEPDGAVEESYSVTESGLFDALTVLGIRTDMDLRAEGENPDSTHAFGANVTHKYYGISMYEGIFEEGEGEKIRAVFSDLADPANYPVYLHCTYGADRTGTICYLLEALLGMDEIDLIREYELTALYHQTVDSATLSGLTQRLNQYEGDNLQQKTENYLLSLGVSAEEIASIRSIFLA